MIGGHQKFASRSRHAHHQQSQQGVEQGRGGRAQSEGEELEEGEELDDGGEVATPTTTVSSVVKLVKVERYGKICMA